MMTSTLSRLILRHALRRPFQSAMFIIGVMIGVAMMVAIDMANFSASRAFELSTESVAGKATHQIIGGATGLPDDLYIQIRRDLGWQAAAPVIEDYVTVHNFDSRPMQLLGIDPFAEPPFRNYIATASRDEIDTAAIGRFLIQPNTVVIGQGIADEYGIQPDDQLDISYGEQKLELTVVAILRPADDLTARALNGLMIADIATAQEIFNQSGRISRIDLIVDEETPAGAAFLEEVTQRLPADARLEVPYIRNEALSQITDSFQLNLTALSLLALIVGMFLIYNTVTFSVVQRRGVLGTLRSLGLTRVQIFQVVLGEAALLSFIGAVLGLGLGVILGRGAVVVVTQTVNDLFFTTSVRTVEISPFTLIKGLLVGVGAALGAASVPAFEATNTPPAGTSRRSEIEGKTRRMIPFISAFGISLALVGAVLLVVPSVEVSIASLFMMLIGLALLTPLMTVYGMRLARPLCGALGGVIGRMAPQSIIRSLSRTSVSIAALMVATSVIVGVSVMVGSFRITVEDWLETTLRADIFISPPVRTFSEQTIPLDNQILEEIANTEGVDKVFYVRSVNLTIPDDPLPVFVNAVSSDISRGRREFIHFRSGYELEEAWAEVLSSHAVFMTESFAHHREIVWSDDLTITLSTPQGAQAFAVLGIFQDFTTSQGSLTMGIETYRQRWQDATITSTAIDIAPDADLDEVIAALETQFAGRDLVVQSSGQLLTSALEVFDRTFAITTALNLLATFVAFVGILSALMSLQLERKREIGILRSNGLTRGQLWRLTMWETGLMGTMAGLLAMPTGMVLATVLTYIINRRSFGWSLSMNLRAEFFIQAFAVALFAALLAGLYPAYKMGKIMPSEALRSE